MQRSICKKLLDEAESHRVGWEGLHRITQMSCSNEVVCWQTVGFRAIHRLCLEILILERCVGAAGLEPEYLVTPTEAEWLEKAEQGL